MERKRNFNTSSDIDTCTTCYTPANTIPHIQWSSYTIWCLAAQEIITDASNKNYELGTTPPPPRHATDIVLTGNMQMNHFWQPAICTSFSLHLYQP